MRWLVGTACAVLGLMAAAQVWLSHQRYELAQQHQDVLRQMNAERKALQQLRLEMASITRPERLRELAERRLDMHPPRPEQVVRL
ncbi:MAG: cell division protein FtsL [Zetaproteobacteria bacterium]|nr:MAG: cell division protein FtsL [Zetaproteobacteria bacterium]